MIQIALLLFGAHFVRRHAYLLGIMGFLWFIAGLVIFVDAFDGIRYFPLRLFGLLLLIESVITLSVASSGVGAQKAVLYFKGDTINPKYYGNPLVAGFIQRGWQ